MLRFIWFWTGLLPCFLYAQTVVSGQVSDDQLLNGIPTASIRWSETDSLLSDARGFFSFTAPKLPLEISLRAEGYQARTLTLSRAGFHPLFLSAMAYELEAVPVLAYESGRNLMTQSNSISILGPRELQRDAGLTIEPILNRVPGVFMHSGALNTNRISIRGIGARSLFSTTKLRAYLEDIPLTNGDGETNLEDLDLSLLQRVEVIRGPASSLYGAGIGGVIHYHLKQDNQVPLGLQVGAQGGSYGLWRYQGIANVATGNGHLHVNFHQMHSDGYRENNEYDRQGLSLTGNWFTSDKGRLTVLFNWIHSKAFIPSSIDSSTYVSNPRAAAFTWKKSKGFEDYDKALLGLSYQQEFSKSLHQTTSLYGSFRNNYELRPFDLLQEQSQSLGFRTRLHGEIALSALPLRWQLGVEGYRENYQWLTYDNVDGQGTIGPYLSSNLEERQYLNVFAQTEWQLSPTTVLSAGLNYNQTQYDYLDLYTPDSLDLSGQYRFPFTFSPRLALNQRIRPDWHLFGSVSHGFSPPSLSETLTPEGQINPDIQPETGWNFEIGTRGRFLQKRLFLDATVFYLPIRNLLVARRTDNDAFVGINAGKSDHFGVEAQVDYRLWQEDRTRIDVFANYTFAHYRFVDFVDGEDVYDGNAIPGIPPHHLNLGLEAQFGVWYGNLNFRYVDAMPLRDNNVSYAEAYSLLNLRLGFRPEGEKTKWEVFGGINNLRNTAYASMLLINAGSFGGAAPRYYYPGLPRNYYFGLNFSLGK